LIAAVAWLGTLLIDVTSDVLTGRYRIDTADNPVARRIQTQFQMLRRIVFVLVATVTLAIMLMTFPAIKHIGGSLLASAGLATLVVGMAMKEALSNIIAGVQIAFTQPFRLEDAVVVEGEWGWIEEIGTMYVVVRIWDLRRLVLPLSYFLDHPFQNWTRTSAQLLANTLLYADYSVPMDELRKELRRICEGTPLWEGEVCVLQASDATEHTVQLRALMDARNSSDAWDLRCLVREKLIEYLRKSHPESPPLSGGTARYFWAGKSAGRIKRANRENKVASGGRPYASGRRRYTAERLKRLLALPVAITVVRVAAPTMPDSVALLFQARVL
jgi:small-conductance mechanosensitive channel